MKKISNIVVKFLLLLLVASSFTTLLKVDASSIPETVKMSSKSSMYYFTGDTGYISGYSTYLKTLTDGTIVYCAGSAQSKAPGGLTLTLKGEADAGLSYIVNNGYPNKSFLGDKRDYYITQSAIWEYFDRTRGTNNWKNTSFENSQVGSMKYYVDLLATAGVNALNNKVTPTTPSISLSATTYQLSQSGNYYVSGLVTVNLSNSNGTYTVNLSNAPSGTIAKNESGVTKTIFNNGEKFRIYVPTTNSISTLKVAVTTSKTTNRVYEYSSGNSKYQDVVSTFVYPETKSASSIIQFNYVKTKLSISKQDITTKKELPGATLVLKNASGNVIDTWVSTNAPHYIENLPVGRYTLTETIAPNGYQLSSETITFDLTNNGVVKTVVMYNQLKNPTKIRISKQDITTKKELPGATLVVKDATGKEIDRWVSTSEPHYLENLEVGKYTLTEVIAPQGYVLSTETISFEVKNDGSVKSVVMYNTLKDKTVIKISKQDITTKKELPGATLVVKDASGNIIDRWVSTNEPHYLENLEVGKYTLTETIAPEGYVLSTETIDFEVKRDGSIQTVVMYNDPKDKTVIKISKQDITTKKELPGATLVVKDASGNIIDRWVSTDEPHYLENLEIGKYTLTETITPEGYELSTETIDFEVKHDGSIQTVVMYNAPSIEVPSTSLNASKMTIGLGICLTLFGIGVVYKSANKE